jgi:membrane-bound lytic murein transglycosylase B
LKFRNSFLSALFFLVNAPVFADYSQHPLAKDFIAEMVTQHQFTAEEITAWLSKAEKRQPILDAIARPAEKTKTWKEYRPIFLVPARISQGVEFWQQNEAVLTRAEKEFGVPAEIMVAIIGVETNYGKNKGKYLVVDALTTLAFDYPPRAPFFRSELINYFLLAREQKHDPLEFKGSYAGAMGFGQFMPSSYRRFAVDYNKDGFTDIWQNTEDAIGSIANYFIQYGWQPGRDVLVPATLVSDFRIQENELQEQQNEKEQQKKAESIPDTIKFNDIVPPQVTVKEWKKYGVVSQSKIGKKEPVIAIEFDGANGMEYWFGLQNFYTITRYNRSPMYAMAVYDLSQAIKVQKNAK